MKSATLFVELIKSGLNPTKALRSLPPYEPPYVNRVRNRACGVTDTTDPSRRFPPASLVRDGWSTAVGATGTND